MGRKDTKINLQKCEKEGVNIPCVSGIRTSLTWLWWFDIRLSQIQVMTKLHPKMLLILKVVKIDNHRPTLPECLIHSVSYTKQRMIATRYDVEPGCRVTTVVTFARQFGQTMGTGFGPNCGNIDPFTTKTLVG